MNVSVELGKVHRMFCEYVDESADNSVKVIVPDDSLAYSINPCVSILLYERIFHSPLSFLASMACLSQLVSENANKSISMIVDLILAL